jgi:hypothetical protein
MVPGTCQLHVFSSLDGAPLASDRGSLRLHRTQARPVRMLMRRDLSALQARTISVLDSLSPQSRLRPRTANEAADDVHLISLKSENRETKFPLAR